MKHSHKLPGSRKGAVLMMVVIFTIIISVTVGTYLQISLNEMRMADRSFHANSCINLAEAGVEEGLFALNHDDWTDWDTDGNDRTRLLSNINLGRNSTGTMQIRVVNWESPTPIIRAQGTASFVHGSVSKQLEVQLRQRTPFANGLTARQWVRFVGGNAYVDSYRSDVGYDPSDHGDNGGVGSVSVEPDAVDIGNATIWGFVATGGAVPDVGPGGKILGFDTPIGVDVDPNRIATDFSSDFEDVEAPYSIGWPILTSTIGLSTSTTPIDYKVSNLNLSGNSTLRIAGPVRIVVDGDVTIRGNARIILEEGASVEFYVNGDFDIAGNGIVNDSTNPRPKDMLVYGTNTTVGGQDIKLGGNAVLYGAVYAPNANIELVGGGGGSGRLFGAAVGHTIFMNGTFQFHYDETLPEDIGDDSYAMASWREVPPPDWHAL